MPDKFSSYQVAYDYVFEQDDFPLAVNPQFGSRSPAWHDHDRFYEIILIVNGTAEHFCEDKKYIVHPQEILVIPPGIHHNYEKCDMDYYNVLVDFKRLKLPLFDLANTSGFQNLFVLGPRSHQLAGNNVVRNTLDVEQFSRAVAILENIYDQQVYREPGYQLAIVSLFMEFLRVICRAGVSQTAAVVQKNIKPHAVANLAMAMAKFCHRNWTVEKMCSASSFSRPVLFREFKKYYGTSPVKFLNDLRLRKACVLLKSGNMNLDAIATACGFASGSYFSTAFKQSFHITPLQYRRQCAAEKQSAGNI